MNIANPNNHDFTPHSGESSNSFYGTSNPAAHSSLHERKSPFKYPQQKKSRQLHSKYEKYEGSKYQSTSFSDRFNTQATFADSISQDQPGENRWLSKWSRDLRGVSGFDLDNPQPSQMEENRSNKTLSAFPAFQGAYNDLERSKSHSRTRSSPYGINENYSGGNNNLSQDFISPRLRKEEIAGLKERKRLERRRGVNEVTPRSNIANSRNLKTESSTTDDQALKVQFYRTERVGSRGFFSPQYGEGEFEGKGKYFGIESTKQKHVSKKSEDRKHRTKKSEAVSFEEEPYRNREYRELRENRESSLYNDVMGSKDYRKQENVREQHKGLSDMRKSKVIDENKVEKLERELRDCQDKLLQAEKFQNQLYQNYVEAKGESEKYREEKEDLINNISFQISQNSILKDQLSQLHERSSQGGRESQKLRDLDLQKSEIIANLENQVSKLKTAVVNETRKCESQIESYEVRIERLEREKQAALSEKEKLERRMEEYLEQQEKSNMEDKAILKKSLEERNRQVKTLKQVNEELTRDLEKLKKQKQGKGDRQYASERETAVTGRYDTDRHETKRMIEEAFNQTKRENSPYVGAELRRYKAEVEKLRAENESLKSEVQGQSTFRRFDQGDNSYEEKLGDTMKDKDKKLGKTSQMGELGRVMREIMKEVGVDDINDAAVRIRDLKEGNKTSSKFTDGVLDLVYKCSPAGYFETRPTVKQAWKWLQRLMEEYMTMKRRTGNVGGPGTGGEVSSSAAEKEIISSLIECLKVQDKNEIVEKVKNLLNENDQPKKTEEKEKNPADVENSFEGGDVDVEKMMEKYGASYSSLAHSYSTARFEDLSKVQSRNSKEFSFARASNPKLKKIMDIDGIDLTEELAKKKAD